MPKKTPLRQEYEIGHIHGGNVRAVPMTGPETSSHARAFGEAAKGTAHFRLVGGQVFWTTPHTAKDEALVDRHYGEKLAHGSAGGQAGLMPQDKRN
jgi:hypothetical protein